MIPSTIGKPVMSLSAKIGVTKIANLSATTIFLNNPNAKRSRPLIKLSNENLFPSHSVFAKSLNLAIGPSSNCGK